MSVNRRALVVQAVVFFVLFAAALFLPAGTLSWLAGWIYLILFFAFFLGTTAWLVRYRPGLAQERTQLSTTDQRGWDKIIFPLLLIAPFACLIFISLDAGRFHWSSVPLWVQAAGALLLLYSFYLIFIAFRENSYASPVVRIQADRGQTVISSGPYQYVRHPMYSGMVVFAIATPLLLGSWYGILAELIFLAVLGRRTVLEERMLLQELPDYSAYKAKVKYRLIPYVW